MERVKGIEPSCLFKILNMRKALRGFRSVPPCHESFMAFNLRVVAPFEIFRKISQNFSPTGVTSPFEARAMPTDATSVVPVSGR